NPQAGLERDAEGLVTAVEAPLEPSAVPTVEDHLLAREGARIVERAGACDERRRRAADLVDASQRTDPSGPGGAWTDPDREVQVFPQEIAGRHGQIRIDPDFGPGGEKLLDGAHQELLGEELRRGDAKPSARAAPGRPQVGT